MEMNHTSAPAVNRKLIVGKRIEWELKRFYKCDSNLEFNGITVASLRRKGFRNAFEGTFDNVVVRLDYHYFNPYDTTILIDLETGMELGRIIDLTKSLHSIVNLEHQKYHLDYVENKGYIFSNSEGAYIAINEFDRTVSPIRSTYVLMESNDNFPNPWLIALICHYYAIHHALGWA